MKYAITVTNDNLRSVGMNMFSHVVEKFPLHSFDATLGARVLLMNSEYNFKIGEMVSDEAMDAITDIGTKIEIEDRYLIAKPICATVKERWVEIKAVIVETISFEHNDRVNDLDERMMMIDKIFPGYITIRDNKEQTKNINSGDVVIFHDIKIMGGNMQTFYQLSIEDCVDIESNSSQSFDSKTADLINGVDNQLGTNAEETKESKSENVEICVSAESVPAIHITDPLPSEQNLTSTQSFRNGFPGCAQYIGERKKKKG